jgi:hypothetical protein
MLFTRIPREFFTLSTWLPSKLNARVRSALGILGGRPKVLLYLRQVLVF